MVDAKVLAPQRAYARLAGLMYLAVLALDIAGVAITSAVHGNGSFLDASHRIAASETLYRVGLLCGVAGSLSTIVLAVGLYVTLKPVDGNLALTAMLFRLVEAASIGTAGFGTLQIYLAANHANVFSTNQLGALVDLTSAGSGTYVGAIFFCVGSTIFFLLFLRSAYIPKILAAWGVFASLVYLLAFIGSAVGPQESGIFLGIGSIPILIAEVSTAFWLLIKGINVGPAESRRIREQEAMGETR
ncbi:MAG TPA: DUF4386 domain-containing protein [Candidatus Dormibacteraeota bacterium]|nr:DUF4386 domain-containing protein [Candidatus Dormibacteraeota bacterium]